MPQPMAALLQASVNGGSPQVGGIIVPASATVQLVPASTIGWSVPATVYQITAFPPGWPAPTGWTYDAINLLYFYVAGGAYGTNPPPLTMPSSGQIASGIWGKWKFKLLVNGGGGALTDTSLALRIDSNTGMQDVANSEGSEFGGPLKWLAALQADLRIISTTIAAGVGGGASLGTGTPSQVSAAAPGATSLLTAAPFDHSHQVVVDVPVTIGTSLAGGSSTSLARADHVHSLTWATVATIFSAASSSLSLNGQRLTNLGAPSSSSDAVTKSYADALVNFTNVNAALAAANAAINVNGQKISGLGAPTANSTDAATTAYVDTAISAIPLLVAGNGLQASGLTWSVKPASDGSIVVSAGGVGVGALASDAQHGNRGNGALHSVADASHNGFMPQGMWSTLNAATASPTANTLVLRGSSGEGGFAWIVAPGSNPAASGFLRTTSAAQTIIAARKADNSGDCSLMRTDGADGLSIGDDTHTGTSVSIVGPSDLSALQVGFVTNAIQSVAVRGPMCLTSVTPAAAPGTGAWLYYDGSALYYRPAGGSPRQVVYNVVAGTGLDEATDSVGGYTLSIDSAYLLPAASGAGKVPYDTGSGWAETAAGSAHQVLHGGSIPTWGQVDLSADVAGLLPLANFQQGTAGQALVTNAGATAPTWVSVSGDASLAASGALTVNQIHGASVPAAGALTTGNGLYASGPSALSYSALNLAGGPGWVTGALPVGNVTPGAAAQLLLTNAGATAPAWVSMSGDASITAAGAITVSTVAGNKVLALPAKMTFSGIAGIQQTSSTTADERGAIVFDPSAIFAGNLQITRTIVFVAVLECAVAGQTCSLELYNITDGATVVTLTTTNTTPTPVTSGTLSVPGNLPNAQKLYGLRLTRAGGTSTNLVACKMARLEVTYS